MASLIVTLLKPQLKQRLTVTAIAAASSGRDDGGDVTAFQFCGKSSSAAVRADAGDFDDRTLWRKSRRARRGLERFSGGAAWRLADRAAALADQKDDEIVAAVVVDASHEPVASLNAVNEAVLAQKIERAMDGNRGGFSTATGP